jgi:microcystin degradation protein MlrC
MKVLIARLNHETNTFSPVPTPLAAFEPTYGPAAYRAHKRMRTAMAAFIDAAEALGATLVTPLSAMANPSGPVHADAYTALTQCILNALPGCDAILLDLHGAMVAENAADGEGALLARVRAAAPGIPVGVALDLHGNLTEAMVGNADVMVGFKTYPLLLAMAQGGPRCRVLWRQLPLMSHTLRSTTLDGAMRQAVQQAQAAEQHGVAAMTVFAGFSLADIAQPFMSVVATVHDQPQALALGQNELAQLANWIWRHRQDFVYRSEPLRESLQRARQMAQSATRPVLLLDHGDNCMSGGTCDTVDVLEAALALNMEGIAMGPLCDPEAVAQLVAAGLGASCTLPIGNKVALPHHSSARPALQVHGTVRAISDGRYTVSGPIYTGQSFGMGGTVLFDIGAAQIVLTEQPHEPWDLGVFHCVGLDPTRFRYLLLKSRMYCRPVFVPLASGLVECDSPGVTTSDYSRFAFAQVQRPAFPLDAV